MFKYSIFETKLGFMGAVASDKGLHLVILPKSTEQAVKKELETHYTDELVRDEKALAPVVRKIQAHLSGRQVAYKEKFDVSGATPFELRVWDAINGIPFGEVRSYEWVAKQIGNAKEVRAVGRALKHNRLPVILPCHRVINKSGDLGGFAGGVELKRKLLKLEGRLW